MQVAASSCISCGLDSGVGLIEQSYSIHWCVQEPNWIWDELDHSATHTDIPRNQGWGLASWELLKVALTRPQFSLMCVRAKCVAGRVRLTTASIGLLYENGLETELTKQLQ